MELWLKNCIFAHIWACGGLNLWLWNPKSNQFTVLLLLTLPPNLKETHLYIYSKDITLNKILDSKMTHAHTHAHTHALQVDG